MEKYFQSKLDYFLEILKNYFDNLQDNFLIKLLFVSVFIFIITGIPAILVGFLISKFPLFIIVVYTIPIVFVILKLKK